MICYVHIYISAFLRIPVIFTITPVSNNSKVSYNTCTIAITGIQTFSTPIREKSTLCGAWWPGISSTSMSLCMTNTDIYNVSISWLLAHNRCGTLNARRTSTIGVCVRNIISGTKTVKDLQQCFIPVLHTRDNLTIP